ncbi:MAG TPA: 3-phosphoshikimate 1-carboxyvinyltransferase [Acidimicrobiales bacterium]|nr:3-phosphoshikimate 1-carboxyvinyltransferase [Acidimicrobiales bacterium]
MSLAENGPPATGAGAVQVVRGGRALTGTIRVPGDKSISHRALLLAALAEGTSTITGLSPGDDVARTGAAVSALGAEVTSESTGLRVRGGRSRLLAPTAPIDLGNAGTAMRLLAGLAAGLPGVTTLTGDDSLRARPMDRVAEPLVRMGAEVAGTGPRCLPPIAVTGAELQGIDYTTPIASAQVKSAVLLAGLTARGDTVVRETVATRAHTEEMLAAAGADIEYRREGRGRVIRLRASPLSPGTFTVPGDPSQAAFWLVGSVIIPGSLVTATDVQLGIERLGYLGVLRRMGATIEVEEEGNTIGSVTAYRCRLHGTVVEAEEIPSLDEVPILAVAAAGAEGQTRFRQMGELRVKESDRFAGTLELIRTFGGVAEAEGDDLVVQGTGGPLRPARFDAHGDHRMAMAAAIAGAACPATDDVTTISGWESVATSYPGFAEDLARLAGGARSGG